MLDMREATFAKEKNCAGENICVVGVDEAGRGPLAGPVVAAAVWYKNASYDIPQELEKAFRLVRDSKTLSPEQREKTFDFILEHFEVGVGEASVQEIDRINILQASLLAMKQAVEKLKAKLSFGTEKRLHLLIDGNQLLKNIKESQEAIVDGDALCKSIAAASIVAKVTRDRLLVEYDREYPAYGFVRHKGYGTKEHMEALRKHGPCAIHRVTFQPVFLAQPENANKKFSAVLAGKR